MWGALDIYLQHDLQTIIYFIKNLKNWYQQVQYVRECVSSPSSSGSWRGQLVCCSGSFPLAFAEPELLLRRRLPYDTDELLLADGLPANGEYLLVCGVSANYEQLLLLPVLSAHHHQLMLLLLFCVTANINYNSRVSPFNDFTTKHD